MNCYGYTTNWDAFLDAITHIFWTGKKYTAIYGLPGLNVETKGDIHNEFLAGYFRSILFRIKHVLKRDYNAKIPPEVLRIHVGAKSFFQKQNFTDSDDMSHWTILDSSIPSGTPKMEESSILQMKRLNTKGEDLLFSLLRLSMMVDMLSMSHFRIGELRSILYFTHQRQIILQNI